MIINELFERISFWRNTDRIGPDILLSHWRLYFKTTAKAYCKLKFKTFGHQSEVRPGCYIFGCSNINIGKRVTIRPNSMIFANPNTEDGNITIEDGVLLGSGVHIYVINHEYRNDGIPIIDQGHEISKRVVLRKGCWLGANVIILPGVEVGENSVIGAGSVVTKSIPRGVLAAGNPAKIIRKN